MNMSSPEITVVIPVYNCEGTIAKCLHSLARTEGPAFEIIVVDDGSTDRTPEICRSFDNLTMISLENGGPSRARNLGIAKARGEFVAFTDGDCIVDEQWLSILRQSFIAPNVVGVGGDQISPTDDTLFGKVIQDFLKIIGFVGDYVKTNDSMKETEHNPSCNAMYRKKILEEVGGFDEAFWPGEDVDLDFKIRRAGYKLLFNPDAVVAHYRPANYKAYGKMMTRYGAAQRRLVTKYGPFRLLHYEPVIMVILGLSISGLLYVKPHLWPIIPLLGALMFLFFLAQARRFSRAVAYLWLLLITLVCWNWGFVRGMHRR